MLVRTCSVDLYRFALRLAGDEALAQDLVQETYQEAWRTRAMLRDPSRARAWLFSILRNRWSHHVRDRSRRPRVVRQEDGAAGPEASSAGLGEQTARRQLVQRALDDLDERFKLPLLMVLLEGRTCQETAHDLGIPLGTVVSRIHRARVRLRAALRRLEGTPRTVPRGGEHG